MTKFVIRRMIQAIPVLFGITIVVYGILLAAPGGPTAKFANNPQDDRGAEGQVQGGLGPRPADPDPVLPLDGLLQPARPRARVLGSLPTPAAFIGPSGWPNFLPDRRSAAPPTACCTATSATRSRRARRSATGSRRAALPTFILAGIGARRLADDRDRARRLRRDPPLLAVRQRGDGVLVRRLRHAHLLAGHHADLHLRGHAQDPAGERDDRHPRRRRRSAATSTGRTSRQHTLRPSGTSAGTCSCR